MKRIAIALLATLVAGLGTFIPETSAQGAGGILRLGVSQCPDGYSGVNYFADCAVPAAGVEFFISTPNTDNVASGISSDFEPITFDLAQFDLNPDGTDTVWIGEPADYAGDYYATCATAQTPMPVAFETVETGEGALYGIAIDFESGDDITCNWYRIAGSDTGEEPGGGEGGVVELPDTGAGPAAVSGWWR
jgi:hypothetical protein